MCDKMAISAYILKIVENDPFLRLQMRAKEMFKCLSYGFLITKELIFGFQILDLKDHFSASLTTLLFALFRQSQTSIVLKSVEN